MTRLVPLGDQAALAYFHDETAAAVFASNLRRAQLPWLVDVVQAYASVGIFFDLMQVGFSSVTAALTELTEEPAPTKAESRKLRVIPCCYKLGLDLERVAAHRQLKVGDVIQLHSQTIYTVYAIGFCPGFPYLGYLPAALCGVPRLETPRLLVEAGSVGVTGRQTGIYTEPRPGGWNVVGRTPLQLVDVARGYFPLRTGDRVRFEPIDAGTFQNLQGKRLDAISS
jgi:inhibitor of KinA